jgi:uncharacterized protein
MTDSHQNAYPSQSQSWKIAGILILSMIVFSPVDFYLRDYTGKEFAFLFHYLLSLGIPFWIFHTQRKNNSGAEGYKITLDSSKILVLIGVGVIALQVGIVGPMANLIPMPEFMKQIVLELMSRTGFFSFLAVVIAAPILEELIFRGIILDGLLKRYSPLHAILLSSILFGIVHLNPWQFVTGLLIGCFAGWVYYRTKNLLYCIFIHFANNCFAFFEMKSFDVEKMFDMSLSEFYGGMLNFIAVAISATLIFSLCLYYLVISFREMDIAEEPVSTPAEEPMSKEL